MDKQLAEYRAKKEKERREQQSWSKSVVGIFGNSKQKPDNSSDAKCKEEAAQSLSKSNVSHIQNGELVYHETEEDIRRNSEWKIFTFQNFLKFLLWLILWKVFIELQFGAVYFLVTGFMFIYFNTRTGPRGPNRLSAYSVFNPNFERLEGTLTAEQFENELLRRPL